MAPPASRARWRSCARRSGRRWASAGARGSRISIATSSSESTEPRGVPTAAIITSGVIVVLVLIAIVQAGCATVAVGRPAVSSAPVGSREAPAHALLERGQALLGRGEMGAAASSLRQALRLQPDLAQARASLGLALYGMGDLDAAVDELHASLSRQPDDIPVRLVLATVLI